MPTTLPRRRQCADPVGVFHIVVVSVCLLGLAANILLATVFPSEAAAIRMLGFG